MSVSPLQASIYAARGVWTMIRDSGRSTVLTENIRPAVDRRSACGVGVPRVM